MTKIGKVIKNDLNNKSIEIQIEGETTLMAGRFALLPIEHYNKLIGLAERFACNNCEFKDIANKYIKPCSECDSSNFVNFKPTFKPYKI